MGFLRVIAVALSVSVAAPAFAQAAQEPGVLDRLRGFFNRILTDEPRPAPEPARPAAPAPVETRTVPSEQSEVQAQPVKPSPSARATSGSLHEFIAKGEYTSALKMIEQGADIEAKDPGAGASVLHYAVMRGRMPMIDLLLSRGADVNSRTRMGTTPLHTAALYARVEVAELLIDAGADVNAQSASGVTALAMAEAARNRPLAAMLRARGAR